jgi:hypothetical protein
MPFLDKAGLKQLWVNTMAKINESKADWNQNDANALDYVKNRTHWVEQELNVIVPATSETSYLYEVNIGESEKIVGGAEYVVTVDGVQYRCIAYFDDENATTILESSLFSIHQCISIEHDYTALWSINFYYPDGKTHTIEIAEPTGDVEYHTLDENFIPETIARKTYVDDAVVAVKNDLLNGAGDAYDTLKELGNLIDDNHDAIDALEAVAANKADSDHRHNYYGVCSTAAATAAKEVDIAGFELVEGAMVIVKFTNSNSASSDINPTLNVSGTGAKPIRRYGTTSVSSGTTTTGWVAGAVQVFVYDGASWIRDYWNNTTYSNASLGQGYGTCSTAAATVAKTMSLSSYSLTAGGVVAVKFTNAVPAGATLNINSKGAKAIYYKGAAITGDVIKAGDVATFIYSTNYHLLSVDRWQNDIDNLRTDIDTHIVDATKHITAAERTNWNAAKTHADSAHAPSDAQKNQNAFSNIAVSGQTTVAADTATDTVTFAGSNVTITTDATNDKVTFSVADGTTSTKGVVQLTNSTSSTSTTTAATPNSVKSAYDLANGKMSATNPVGTGSFSMNRKTGTTVGTNSVALGNSCTASGAGSHAEGYNTTASGNYTHAECYSTTASGSYSHAEGQETTASNKYSHAEGGGTTASGEGSHAEGYLTTASGKHSHAEGTQTTASGHASHAEGYNTTASGLYAHAEGLSQNQLPDTITTTTSNADIISTWNTTKFTLSKEQASHAEGQSTLALGSMSSHAEGCETIASGDIGSHAEGFHTTASGSASHAEGHNTTASGLYSHAEGRNTTASNTGSHAEGSNTSAQGRSQHAQGEYNITETNVRTDVRGVYAHIVGNGTAEDARSNAHTLDWDGNAWFAGDVYVGSTSGTNKDAGSVKLASETYVATAVDTAIAGITAITTAEIDAICGASIYAASEVTF